MCPGFCLYGGVSACRGNGMTMDERAIDRARESAEHAVRLRRRIHDLARELHLALALYEPHIAPPGEDPEAIERFRAELRRFRGGADIACPVLANHAEPGHVGRLAIHLAANALDVAPSAIERNGTASKPVNIERVWGQCERCGAERVSVRAAVQVHDGRRFHLEQQRLCVDCYDDALADDK